jgi:mercuric reductase
MKIPHKKPKRFDYDLVVIGTGSGGNVAAHTFSRQQKRVAMIEMEFIGGECPNIGCVPTKSLLHAAEVYKAAKEGKDFGIYADVRINYPRVKAWKDLVVRRTGTSEGEEIYRHEGIDLFRGKGTFVDQWTIEVNGKHLTSRHFLIATGTRSIAPPIPGLKEAGFIGFREAINLTSPLKSVFVIGGGAIGCEFAELFHTFEAKVHIADIAPRLLPLEDPEGGELLQEVFEAKGIELHLGAQVAHVTVEKGKKIVHYQQDGKIHQAKVDEIFVSAGMAPNTDIGLENAGVAYTKRGITTNLQMQTTTKHIYAAGDVVGPYRFTHTAAYQSRIAAHNMLNRKRKVTADYHAVTRCVFVDPEIANVGPTEQQLQEQKIAYEVGYAPIDLIGRANTTDVHKGFVKVVAAKKTGVLLAATIASPRAGEMMHELALAIQHGLTADHIVDTIHAFPTWSEAVRLACVRVGK